MSPLAIPSPEVGLGTGSSSEVIIGTGASVPSGVDMPISYNSLLLNNRQWIDTYVVNKIAGLSDAAIRDDRENNPSADGETAFDAYYGGKTFTLSGYIRAFNLAKLDDMEQALRAAFHDIKTEKEMIFLHRNPLGVAMIMCKKGAELVLDDEQTTENYFKRDFMITMKASNPNILAKVDSYESKKLAWLDEFLEDSLGDYTFISGPGMTVSSGYLRPTDNTANSFVRNDSLDFPDVGSVVEYKVGTGASPADGSEQRIYLRFQQNGLETVYAVLSGTSNLQIVGVVDGVATILATDSTSYSPAAGSTYFFFFTAIGNQLEARVYTTDPRKGDGGTLVKSVSHTISGFANVTAFGIGTIGDQAFTLKGGTSNGSTWGFTNISTNVTKLTADPVLTTPNLGNGDAEPLIRITGDFTSPVITNGTRGETMSFTKNGGASLLDGQYYEIDIANDTILDENGLRRWENFAIGSDWIKLSPGEDQILMTASSVGIGWDGSSWFFPEISFTYRSTWV